MGKPPNPAPPYLCRSHGRLSVPVLYEGEQRMRHAGPGLGLVPFAALH